MCKISQIFNSKYQISGFDESQFAIIEKNLLK